MALDTHKASLQLDLGLRDTRSNFAAFLLLSRLSITSTAPAGWLPFLREALTRSLPRCRITDILGSFTWLQSAVSSVHASASTTAHHVGQLLTKKTSPPIACRSHALARRYVNNDSPKVGPGSLLARNRTSNGSWFCGTADDTVVAKHITQPSFSVVGASPSQDIDPAVK